MRSELCCFETHVGTSDFRSSIVGGEVSRLGTQKMSSLVNTNILGFSWIRRIELKNIVPAIPVYLVTEHHGALMNV